MLGLIQGLEQEQGLCPDQDYRLKSRAGLKARLKARAGRSKFSSLLELLIKIKIRSYFYNLHVSIVGNISRPRGNYTVIVTIKVYSSFFAYFKLKPLFNNQTNLLKFPNLKLAD